MRMTHTGSIVREAGFAALASLALLSLAACYFFPKEEKVPAPPLVSPPAVTYHTVDVAKGAIESKVVVSGSFVFADQAVLSFNARSGWLKRVSVALDDVVKPGTLIAELDTGNLEFRIEEQKLLARKAELVAERTKLLRADRIENELAAIDVDLTRLRLQDLQNELAQYRLFSPIAGVVVYLTTTIGGGYVDASRTIAQVADPKRLQVLYRGDKVPEFHKGMKVSVQVGSRSYTGEVVMTPGTAPRDVSPELQNAILVRLPSLPPEGKPGSFATLTLVKQRKEDALIVPRDLVNTFLGRNFVQVLKDGIKKERTVELGIQNDTMVEVVNGLAEGEKLASP